MGKLGFWVLLIVAIVLGRPAAWAQEPAFELQFSRPSRINAVKAWGDRVCAIDFDDFRLRCFDRGGRQTFDVDIRDRVRGGFNRMAKIIDYTMLDDGGAAVLGFVVDPEARGSGEDFFPYVSAVGFGRRGEPVLSSPKGRPPRESFGRQPRRQSGRAGTESRF